MLTKTAAPLAATALAISANTPIGVASITSPTIFSSTADSDCNRPAKGLPASPVRTVPTPTRIATKISASMSPFAKASTMLSGTMRSEEHTSELQSLMRHSYAVFCLKKKKHKNHKEKRTKKIHEQKINMNKDK